MECDNLYGWIRKMVIYANNLTKHGEPQSYSWECRRRRSNCVTSCVFDYGLGLATLSQCTMVWVSQLSQCTMVWVSQPCHNALWFGSQPCHNALWFWSHNPVTVHYGLGLTALSQCTMVWVSQPCHSALWFGSHEAGQGSKWSHESQSETAKDKPIEAMQYPQDLPPIEIRQNV